MAKEVVDDSDIENSFQLNVEEFERSTVHNLFKALVKVMAVAHQGRELSKDNERLSKDNKSLAHKLKHQVERNMTGQ
ncbi:hypothetical protein ACB092_08G019600 [Castanea dentata]